MPPQSATEVQQLEADFLSGRNPLAYIPLCQALRRQRQYGRALELCQAGLTRDPGSVAGRTLLARLLADVGKYTESLSEIERAEMRAPEAMGLMIEKARCQIKLRRTQEADATLRLLDARNPLDPQVQLLHTQLRQLRSSLATENRSSDAQPTAGLDFRPDEVIKAVKRHLQPLCTITSIALLSITSGQSSIEGDSRAAEAAERIFHEIDLALSDMEQGAFRLGVAEMERCVMFVLRGRGRILVMCTPPSVNFGKVYHRLNIVMNQLLPSQRPPRSSRDDERTEEQ